MSFFFRDSKIKIEDDNFWTHGYHLQNNSTLSTDHDDINESVSQTDIPDFLREIVDDVLQAGKSVEMLQALGNKGRYFAFSQYYFITIFLVNFGKSMVVILLLVNNNDNL